MRAVLPLLGTLAVLCVCLLQACAPVHRHAPREPRPSATATATATAAAAAAAGTAAAGTAPRLVAPATIPVRLTALEGRTRLVFEAPGGSTELVRHGPDVFASDGRSGRSLELPDRSGPVRIEGRAYRGSLLVVPHPGGGLRVTNHVPLEEYVRAVVAAELVLWSARPAELEAQAIAARSYALSALRRRAGSIVSAYLRDDTQDQVYRGVQPAPGERLPAAIVARLDAALAATRGLVLVLDDELLDARFHASCGGSTTAFANVFVEGGPGTGGARCVHCEVVGARQLRNPDADESPRVAWRWTAEPERLAAVARELELGTRLVRLQPVTRDGAGRWLTIALEGDRGRRTLSSAELRRHLGNVDLKSTVIVRTWPHAGEPITGGVFFEGVGRGHGVGLCQVGTRTLAELGWSAERILGHYYPGAQIARLR